MARYGPDSGSSHRAPIRSSYPSATARRDFQDISYATNPRMEVDRLYEFVGKLTTPFAEGLAIRTTGTPTAIAQVASSANGEVNIGMAATNELEFNGYDWTDNLQIPATANPRFEAYVKTPAAALVAAEDFIAGLATQYNSTLNTVAKYVRFRLSGSNALLIEGKDGTNTFNAIATGVTLSAATYYLLRIERKVQDGNFYFFVEDQLVGKLAVTAFAATDLLQPSIGVRKASGATTTTFVLDYMRVAWARVL